MLCIGMFSATKMSFKMLENAKIVELQRVVAN